MGRLPRPRNPQAEIRAVTLLAQGRSLREVAREVGVSTTTVLRWRDRQAKEAEAKVTAGPPLPQDLTLADLHLDGDQGSGPDPGLDLGDMPQVDPNTIDPLREVAQQIADYGRMVEGARQRSDLRMMKELSAARAKLYPVYAALKRSADQQRDAIVIPRDAFAAKRAEFVEKFDLTRKRPLLCEKCSRELSSEWAIGSPEKRLR